MRWQKYYEGYITISLLLLLIYSCVLFQGASLFPGLTGRKVIKTEQGVATHRKEPPGVTKAGTFREIRKAGLLPKG